MYEFVSASAGREALLEKCRRTSVCNARSDNWWESRLRSQSKPFYFCSREGRIVRTFLGPPTRMMGTGLEDTGRWSSSPRKLSASSLQHRAHKKGAAGNYRNRKTQGKIVLELEGGRWSRPYWHPWPISCSRTPQSGRCRSSMPVLHPRQDGAPTNRRELRIATPLVITSPIMRWSRSQLNQRSRPIAARRRMDPRYYGRLFFRYLYCPNYRLDYQSTRFDEKVSQKQSRMFKNVG